MNRYVICVIGGAILAGAAGLMIAKAQQSPGPVFIAGDRAVTAEQALVVPSKPFAAAAILDGLASPPVRIPLQREPYFLSDFIVEHRRIVADESGQNPRIDRLPDVRLASRGVRSGAARRRVHQGLGGGH